MPRTEYDNELKGALFKNKNRESDKHPHYTGSSTLQGVDYWVSAWMNESDKGVKYFALKFNPKDDRDERPRRRRDYDDDEPRRERPSRRDDDEGLPF